MTPKLVVLSNARPGRDEEFNAWYDDVHAVDVLTRLEGYHEVRRYATGEAVGERPWRYLAVWDITDGCLERTISSTREMHARQASGEVDPEDTLYRPNPGIAGYARSWWVPRTHVDGPADRTADDAVFAIFSSADDAAGPMPTGWSATTVEALARLMVEATEHELAPQQLEDPSFSALLLVRVPGEAIERARAAVSAIEAAHPGWWFVPISKPLVLEADGRLTRSA